MRLQCNDDDEAAFIENMGENVEKAIDQVSETESNDGEITLIDLFAVLWKRKFLIIGITFVVAVFSVVYSVISLVLPPEKSYLPNVFTVNTDIVIKEENWTAQNANLGVFLLTNREFFDAVIEKFNLYEKFALDPKKGKLSITAARNIVSGMIKASYNKNNGVFTISCTNLDSQFAFDIVNYAMNYLEQKFLAIDENLLEKKNLEASIDSCNKEIQRLQQLVKEEQEQSDGQSSDEQSAMEMYFSKSYASGPLVYTSINLTELSAQQSLYSQLKSQYLKVDVASQTPVYQIISPPEIPDKKSGPSRGKICITNTVVSFCLSILLSFLLEAFKNLKVGGVATKFKRLISDN